LVHEPRTVDDELEGVALGIAGVDRPRVAVIERHEVRVALGDELLLNAAERRQVLEAEGQLEEHRSEGAAGDGTVEHRALGASRGQHELVVLGRIGGQEHQRRETAGDLAAIGDGHPEDAGVEVLHLGQGRNS
jgi:hypothetical protein